MPCVSWATGISSVSISFLLWAAEARRTYAFDSHHQMLYCDDTLYKLDRSQRIRSVIMLPAQKWHGNYQSRVEGISFNIVIRRRQLEEGIGVFIIIRQRSAWHYVLLERRTTTAYAGREVCFIYVQINSATGDALRMTLFFSPSTFCRTVLAPKWLPLHRAMKPALAC